jgi:hypothetical protein
LGGEYEGIKRANHAIAIKATSQLDDLVELWQPLC